MTSTKGPSLDQHSLLAAISRLGIGGSAPFIDGEFRGGQCQIYKTSFRDVDSESLAVRVPLYMSVGSPDDALIYTLRAEWAILEMLETKGFPWAPKCRGRSLTFDNPIKLPFLVYTWAHGFTPDWNDEVPSRPLRDKLLGQLAAIQMSLIQSTLETRSTTVKSFFERLIDNRQANVQNGKFPDLCDQDCVDQRALLPQIIGEHGGDSTFALNHGDFKPDNIIVDAEYNIICVIDWGFAAMVPILRAAGPPRFLWGPNRSATAEADWASYIATFAFDDSPAASYMRSFQAVEDVDFRTLYVESLFSKGMHAFLAAKNWKLPLA